MTRITELEEELKSTRDGYEEEITILVETNDGLTRKLALVQNRAFVTGQYSH